MEIRSLVCIIEAYLKDLLRNSPEGWIEVRRRDVAERFSCVPSQITYVINTRFSTRNGYLVESHRGGGGYIRICSLCRPPNESPGLEVREAANTPGSEGENILNSLAGRGIITEREYRLLTTAFALIETTLPGPEREDIKLQLIRAVLATGEFF
jgi:transcriptional regulator CtsR